jgi:hypothetical protein
MGQTFSSNVLSIKNVAFDKEKNTITLNMTDNTSKVLTLPVATPGVGIRSAKTDGKGKMILTMTDNTTQTVILPEGPKGVPGAIGPKGERGLPGPTGDAGAKGDKGDTGPAGAKGDIGPTGAKGDAGPKGDKGDVGPQGPAGAKGDTGPAGAKGDAGPKGDTGPLGPKGDVGPAGAKGDTGPKGDVGAVGPQGPAGAGGISWSSPLTKTPLGINFSNAWQSTPDSVTNVSEISNDTNNYKTLMIVGNKSAGAERRVGVWDRLDVHGVLGVDSNVNIGGKLCIGPANNNWCFNPNPNGQWLDIRRNNATGDKPDTAEFHLTQDGNLFLNRSTQQGWVADNIRNPKVDNIAFNGSPWNLRQEGGQYLVFRNSSSPDYRYAFFPNQYVDVSKDNLRTGDVVTIRSNKPGMPESRAQRRDDGIMAFTNNNRGSWETMTLEKM